MEDSAVEDLGKEHGLLNRILLIYEDLIDKYNKGIWNEDLISIGKDAAYIVRIFIENHHEELEEAYVFPVIERMHKKYPNNQVYKDLSDITHILRQQHDIGRELTDNILKNGDVYAMESFRKMYRAHEAREDTQVFPMFHSLCTEKEYKEISNIFEEIEHSLFGQDGYENMLKRVIHIESTLGINDLNIYTP